MGAMNSEIKDKCLFLGMPGVVFLGISLLLAIKVGNDFNGSDLVECVIFVGSNAMLWMVYVVLQYTFLDIYLYVKKKGKTDTVEQISLHEDIIPIETQTAEQYMQRNQEFQQEQKARKRELVSAIIEYVNYTMSPFVRNEDMTKLRNEILMWTENPKYVPDSVALKCKLKTLDLRHFIWNVGERLGMDNGYDGKCRMNFVKALFHDVFDGMEDGSIRNFKVAPNNGRIKIDEPDKGSFAFHYPDGYKSRNNQ